MPDQIDLTDTVERKLATRRSLVKGAAWATPAVVAAVAAPAVAATTDTWNLRVDTGCLFGVAGVDAFPGFRFTETLGQTPPTTLTLTQTFTYTGSYDYSRVVPGAEAAAKLGATTIGVTNLGIATILNAVQFKSSKVSTSSYGSIVYTETGRTNSGISMTHVTFTQTISRTITITGLNAGETVGLGYLINSSISLPGASVTNRVTAGAGSGGQNGADNTAALSWDLLSLGC